MCICVCVCTCTRMHPGKMHLSFPATSRMHHLRDILWRYRRGTCSSVHPFSPLPLYGHARHRFKGVVHPYELRDQPARRMTVYDNYYNSAGTFSFPLVWRRLSVPRLAQFLAKRHHLSSVPFKNDKFDPAEQGISRLTTRDSKWNEWLLIMKRKIIFKHRKCID